MAALYLSKGRVFTSITSKCGLVALKPLAHPITEFFSAHLIKNLPVGEIERGIIELQERETGTVESD